VKLIFRHCSLECEKVSDFQMPLQAILECTAESFMKKTAITYGNQKFTYQELEMFSSRFAVALADCGVKKNERVALFLQNSPEFVIAFFGVLKAGAVITAVNPLHKEREVLLQLCDSGAQTIVILESFYSIVKKIFGQTLLKNVIVVTTDGCLKIVEKEFVVLDFWSLIKNVVYKQLHLEFDSREDLAVLQYTSGTTGVPKGVMLSHRNLVSNVQSFATWLKGTSRDVFLSVLPFFHVYGMTTSMLVPVSLGAEMVVLPKFNPVKSLQAVERCGVSVFCGSPTMYAMLVAVLEMEKWDFKTVRVCISGAASLPVWVQKRFIEVSGCLLVEGYGLTEASPVTHCTPIDTLVGAIKIGSIGVPLLGTEARIVDLESGCNALAVGEIGELAVKGSQVMKGYWQKSDETSQVLRDGWLLTGDVAYIDFEGYFYIVGRMKDVIKHKDYSVCPKELENVLYEHSCVKFCAVVGKPNGLFGEVAKAFVVLKDGTCVTEEELIEFVNSKVAVYKKIEEVEFCSELPKCAKRLGYFLKEQT